MNAAYVLLSFRGRSDGTAAGANRGPALGGMAFGRVSRLSLRVRPAPNILVINRRQREAERLRDTTEANSCRAHRALRGKK